MKHDHYLHFQSILHSLKLVIDRHITKMSNNMTFKKSHYKGEWNFYKYNLFRNNCIFSNLYWHWLIAWQCLPWYPVHPAWWHIYYIYISSPVTCLHSLQKITDPPLCVLSPYRENMWLITNLRSTLYNYNLLTYFA